MLCYMEHPFEDGAKLRILNAKFTLPEFDKEYDIFHDLLRMYSVMNSLLCIFCCNSYVNHQSAHTTYYSY